MFKVPSMLLFVAAVSSSIRHGILQYFCGEPPRAGTSPAEMYLKLSPCVPARACHAHGRSSVPKQDVRVCQSASRMDKGHVAFPAATFTACDKYASEPTPKHVACVYTSCDRYTTSLSKTCLLSRGGLQQLPTSTISGWTRKEGSTWKGSLSARFV